MPCEWLKGPDGSVIHINRGRGGGKKKLCPFCKRGAVSKLCDFPIGDGKTCDAEMCQSCATTKGAQHTDIGGGFTKLNDTVDYCPKHKHQSPRKDVHEMRQPHVTSYTDISLSESDGCTYNEGTAEKPAICKKACNPGQRMCPRHLLIAEHEAQLAKQEAEKAAEIERRKNRSPIGRQHA